MKDSELIKKYMAEFLGRKEAPRRSFQTYYSLAQDFNQPKLHERFRARFFNEICIIADKNKKQNVIFGVLTNGEIFVEVNGEQHTPADSFYKMATIQSAIISHQVRDLEDENRHLRAEISELIKQKSNKEEAYQKVIGLLEVIVDSQGDSYE